jgi:hypothetical protein
MSSSERRIRARFDSDSWSKDMHRASAAAGAIAETAKRRYTRQGVLLAELRPCQAEGRDGTELPDCAKVYLPAPTGRFGMVFSVDREAGTPTLVYIAYGVRHHPRESNAPTVYQIAHQRLRDQRDTKEDGSGAGDS